MASATEKLRRKTARRALSGIVTLCLAAAFSTIEWPVHRLRDLALPNVSRGNLPLAMAVGTSLVLLIAVAVLAVLYVRALRAGRQTEAARESAASALRSHRTWLTEMEEKYTAASAASRFQSLFVAHVSNELRMPINAMLGFSEIIKDEMFGPIGTPRYKGYAQSIHQSAGQLLRSVNNLLDLSRITADRLELRERAIDLPVVLAQITNGFATAAESRSLSLTLEVKENLPRLRADLRLLRSMLQALISNAVKFIGKRQKVTVRAALDDGNRIVIAILSLALLFALRGKLTQHHAERLDVLSLYWHFVDVVWVVVFTVVYVLGR